MKKLLFAILISVVSSGFCQIQNKIEIRLINKQNSEPIPFILVKIKENNTVYKTNLNGVFFMEHVPFNDYTLEVKDSAFVAFTKTFNVTAHTPSFEFKLEPNTNILGEVVVTNKGDFSPIRKMRAVEGVLVTKGKKTEVILVGEINGNKAAGSGRQLYSRIPGLNIWESDGAGIQLGIGGRGLSPTRTSNYNTRQNGYDISADALGYPESYYTPPIEAVQEIQLIRGAASLQFGTQFGGLINFVMKKGPQNKKFELTARHTLGSFGLNSSFISVGGSTPSFNYYAFYQHKFGNDWRPNSKFKVHSGGVYLTKNFTEKFKVSADFTKMYYITQQPGGLTDLQFNSNPMQSNRDRNWFEVDWNLAAIQFDYEFNSKTRLNSRFFGLIASRKALGFLGQITRVDPLEERDLISGHFKNFGNETRFLKVYNVKKMTWAYLAGFRYYHGYNKSEQGLAPDGNAADFYYLNPNHLEGSSYEFPNQNLSLFAEHIFNFSSKFSVTPGIRFEYINTNASGMYRNIVEDLAGNVIFDSTYADSKSNARAFVIAGVGLTYKLNDFSELYSNFSQNYRSINFSDMQIQNPNFKIDPNLEDEKGFNADLGFRGGIKNKLSYDISLFGLYYHNRIGTTIETDPVLFNTYQYRTNISSSLTNGVEAVVDINFWKWFVNDSSNFDLSCFINTSLVNSKYINSEEAAFKNKKVELVPPFNLKTGITAKYKSFSGTIQYSYTHQHFSDATNSIQQPNAVNGIIPTYQILDLSLKYSNKMFQIETGINNLTNASYFTRRATGYPGPGIIPSSPRNFYATLQIQL